MPCRSDYDYCHVVQGSPTLLLRDSACFAKSLSFKAHRKGETFPLDALAVLNVCNTKVLFQTSSVCVCACVFHNHGAYSTGLIKQPLQSHGQSLIWSSCTWRLKNSQSLSLSNLNFHKICNENPIRIKYQLLGRLQAVFKPPWKTLLPAVLGLWFSVLPGSAPAFGFQPVGCQDANTKM